MAKTFFLMMIKLHTLMLAHLIPKIPSIKFQLVQKSGVGKDIK